MNTNIIDQLKDALSTSFVSVDGVTVYTPDGQPEGIVTFEFKKWEGHTKVDYFQISIKFNDAKAIAKHLDMALKNLDMHLHIMKEKSNDRP